MAKRRRSAKAGELDAFLKRLGERVRTMRSRRGMSRKVLARHSRVSERYLAQLEAGAGNCSIVLLRRIAHAMSVPVAELIDERPDRPVESLLLAQLLDRLAPAELTRAREVLLAQFGGPSSATRNGRIALIGLRGGGKSTLGRRLAAELKVPFVELDREIERQSGMALAELFEMFGQETFRRLERAALEKALAANERCVLATGGSLVTEPGTFELLLASCLTVWVRAKPTEHMARVIAQGDLRPMADNARAMDDLVAILMSREPLYAKADLTLDTAGKTAAQSARELLELIASIASARHSGARAKRGSPESRNTGQASPARAVFLDSGLAGFARDPE
jgi:XRE family aerobic/anaerobic benzoate catabolism transcriptional regulator